MMEFDLSYLNKKTAMPSRVWACSLNRISPLSVLWLKYPIENIPNHVLESGVVFWMSSNGVVSSGRINYNAKYGARSF